MSRPQAPMLLIVEDERAIVQEIGDYFRQEGFIVRSAFDGRTGLEILEREKPSVVFLDLHLPDISGLEVLKRSRQLYPAVKVIVNSATLDSTLIEEARRLGCHVFVSKPFDLFAVRREIDGLAA